MNKKCARESYRNTNTQSSISPALYSQLLVIMDVEVFIDTWLRDLVTNLRQLMSLNTLLSSNIADIWVFVVNRYPTQMTVMIGFMLTAVHFQLQNQEILSAQFLLCGVYLLSSIDLVD